ncbi:hypothetical protein OF001_U20049 [Pseudomonas sp. OF001]|nr:hypothetical protein OF001_U20049 [Pseudomonas sp. OF001]
MPHEPYQHPPHDDRRHRRPGGRQGPVESVLRHQPRCSQPALPAGWLRLSQADRNLAEGRDHTRPHRSDGPGRRAGTARRAAGHARLRPPPP